MQEEFRNTQHLVTRKVIEQVIIFNTIISCYKQNLEVSAAEEVLQKATPKDGPFLASVNTSLGALHVERQAYHGATFVGNHVHKLLQVHVTKDIIHYRNLLHVT